MSGVFDPEFRAALCKTYADLLRRQRTAGRPPSVPAVLTFHTLRHVAVTAMADAGVPYNVTQRRAGHSTARMTMEHYSHRSTEADKDAAASLQSYFAGAFTEGRGIRTAG